jgi:DNA-binding GntR family transcriptional regulator
MLSAVDGACGSAADGSQNSGKAPVAFERLEQRTTPDNVVAVVRQAILDGTLAPGVQLREAHIAAELGVSRAPLREALSKLEEEGLVVKVRYRGTFVAEVGPKVVEEIATLRLRLEPFAVERSLPWLRGAGRSKFKGLVTEMKKASTAGDVAACIDAHLALHRLFYEAADHKLLLDLWNAWESQLRLFLAVDLRDFVNPMEVARDHAKLFGIVQNGDVKAITRELEHHIHGAGSSAAASTGGRAGLARA